MKNRLLSKILLISLIVFGVVACDDGYEEYKRTESNDIQEIFGTYTGGNDGSSALFVTRWSAEDNEYVQSGYAGAQVVISDAGNGAITITPIDGRAYSDIPVRTIPVTRKEGVFITGMNEEGTVRYDSRDQTLRIGVSPKGDTDTYYLLLRGVKNQ